MKTAYVVTLCALLLLVSACAQKVNDPADAQAIKKLLSEYAEAGNANNPAWSTSTYYLDDAVRMPPNGSLIKGKEAIAQLAQASIAEASSTDVTLPVDEVYLSGDLALARGKYTSTDTPKASGLSVIRSQGKWGAAYQRQSDGSWKCIFDIWNSDQPSPGATSDGADEQTLFQIERDFAAAFARKDAAAIDKFLAKDFVSNYGGRTMNRT